MKLERHSKIVKLIGKKEIETQEELVEELRKAGFCVTQATVPRDIRRIRPTRVAMDNGKQRCTVMQNEDLKTERYARVLRSSYQDMDRAQNPPVIKTASGIAMAVAALLDAVHFHEVMGCVTGDDAVPCTACSTDDTLLPMGQIRKMLLG